jgi:hypothetical protein
MLKCTARPGRREGGKLSSSSSPRPEQIVSPLDPIGDRVGVEVTAFGAPHTRAEGRHRYIVRPPIDIDRRQVTSNPRTPFWRMLPSVIGRNGSSRRVIAAPPPTDATYQT